MLTKYLYTCLDSSGQEIKGVITTSDRKEAISGLRDRGLTVIDLLERKEKERKRFLLKKEVGDQDLYNISRELSILLRAGIRIDHGIKLLMNSITKQELKDTLSRALVDIKAGKRISQAFDQTGRFSPLYITMIHVGEAVGNLQGAFENIAQYYKFQIQFKGEIRNALTYPAFLIFASITTLFAIFYFIVPRFFSIFGTNTGTLPLPARVIHTLSGWLGFPHLFIVAGIVMAILLGKKFIPSTIKFTTLSSHFIHLPFIGKLILNMELSRYCYAMYSMLQSGVEFIRAMKLSSALVQNHHLRNPLESLIEQIKGGKKIADVFSQVHLLPEIVPNMLMVGEGSGNLKEIFFELYQVFDERFKNTTKRALVLVEPSIIVIVGLIVGFIVISLILTVMSVGSIKL